MPYRSHVQQLLPELTLDGEELLVERDVRDGTSESSSESMYESSSESELPGEIVWRAKRLVSWSSVSLVVLSVDDFAGLVRALWAGRCDPFGRDGTALGDRGS